MARRSSTATFRRDNELVIHKLIPHACAYGAALNDGDPAACEGAIEDMAALLASELKMPCAPVATAEAAAAIADSDKVTPIGRPRPL